MFLQGAADKLKREQEKRKADLQRRQAAECRAAAVAEAHRRERDDVEKQERHETRMREAEERAARERILANNEGISWETRLSGVRSDAAVMKGIRNRADDKVVLPPSAWRALQSAGAASSDRGHLFFEIARDAGSGSSASAGPRLERTSRRTHVAVLGFDGVEGTVGLPPAVLRQLGVSTAGTTGRAAADRQISRARETAEEDAVFTTDGASTAFGDDAISTLASASSVVDVRVSYRRLPRGTYCKLQPKSQDFQTELASEAGVDLRALLETAMTRRCTLSVGDEVVVESSGSSSVSSGASGNLKNSRSYALRCVEVQPDDAGAVSLMETDIEVDIAPSEDYEAAMRRVAEAEAARLAAAAEAAARDADAARAAARATAEAQAELEKQASEVRAAETRAAAFRAAAYASLPPEPPDPDETETDLEMGDDETEKRANITRARFAFPDGATRTRRFRASDPLASAFAFVRALGGASEREAFDLVTRFPRAVIREPSGEAAARETVGECAAFVDAAASGGALFVERRASS